RSLLAVSFALVLRELLAHERLFSARTLRALDRLAQRLPQIEDRRPSSRGSGSAVRGDLESSWRLRIARKRSRAGPFSVSRVGYPWFTQRIHGGDKPVDGVDIVRSDNVRIYVNLS